MMERVLPLIVVVAVVAAGAVLGLVGLIAAPFVLVAVGLATGRRALSLSGLVLGLVLIAYVGVLGVGGGAEGGVVR
jgi:hypothetical protein